MTPDPIILKALMWVAIILSLPSISWAFRVIGEVVARLLFPGKTITLTIIENGAEHQQTIYLKDTDALVEAILSMKENSGT